MSEREQRDSREDYYTDRAVKIAQRVRSKHPLHIGDIAAHPSDEYTYELLGVEGSIAHLGYTDETTGELVRRNYPFDEIFDVKLAMDIAVRLSIKGIEKAIRSRLN